MKRALAGLTAGLIVLLCGVTAAMVLAADTGVGFCNHHACTTTTTTTTTTTPPPPVYLFDDEFSGTGNPDASKWHERDGCPSDPAWTYSCLNANNSFLDGSGHLVLRVTPGTKGRAYDGAGVDTFVYDGWPPSVVLAEFPPPIHVEARIRFAPGAGLWQAFWFNSDSAGGTSNLELDVQEFRGAYPTQDSCHTHGIKEWGAAIDTGADLAAAWHTYWIDYHSDSVTFGVDGLTCGTTTLPNVNLYEMIRLTTHVGPPGTWGGEGGPPPDSALPADMLVDWVRVT